MKVLSLYTGAGGLDLGLEAAGFETRVAVEFDSDAVATIGENRDWPVIDRDIDQIPSAELLERGEMSEGDFELLIGGPPCQPFSKSAYWATGDTQRLNDPRASTLEHYLRVLKDTKPVAFLLENVPGLGYKGKDEGLERLKKVLQDINAAAKTDYGLSVQVLNAVDYGVPQERKRLFAVGHRDGLEFEFPRPTHRNPSIEGEEQLSLEELSPYLTAWDALADIEEDPEDPELQVGGKWADLLPTIPEGENYLYHTDRGDGLPLFGWRRRFWNFLLKLSKSRPSWTITAQPGSATGPFHWESRRLSRRELCRLQTFPDGFEVTGSLRAAHKQIGNAVPAALAERLGLEIRRQLLGDSEIQEGQELSLLPSYSRPIPPPEEVSPVPEKYLHRVGDHDEHPGEGKGPGARARASASG